MNAHELRQFASFAAIGVGRDRKWINKVLGTSAQALHEHRILNGVHASEGEARRLVDLLVSCEFL
nr:hypothetical protein [Streptomyces chartreusis]